MKLAVRRYRCVNARAIKIQCRESLPQRLRWTSKWFFCWHRDYTQSANRQPPTGLICTTARRQRKYRIHSICCIYPHLCLSTRQPYPRDMVVTASVQKCSLTSYKSDDEIRRGPLDLESQTRVEWFSTSFAALYLGNGARYSICCVEKHRVLILTIT